MPPKEASRPRARVISLEASSNSNPPADKRDFLTASSRSIATSHVEMMGSANGGAHPRPGGGSASYTAPLPTAVMPPPYNVLESSMAAAPPLQVSAFERAFAAVEAAGHSAPREELSTEQRLLATLGAGAENDSDSHSGAAAAAAAAAGEQRPPLSRDATPSSQHDAGDRPPAPAGGRLEASRQAQVENKVDTEAAAATGESGGGSGGGGATGLTEAAAMQDQRLRLLTHHLRERPLSPGNLSPRPASPASSVTDTERQFLEALDDQHAQVGDLKEENKLLERTISATLTAEVMASSAVQAAEADMRKWLLQAEQRPPSSGSNGRERSASPQERAVDRAGRKSQERHRAAKEEKRAEEPVWRQESQQAEARKAASPEPPPPPPGSSNHGGSSSRSRSRSPSGDPGGAGAGHGRGSRGERTGDMRREAGSSLSDVGSRAAGAVLSLPFPWGGVTVHCAGVGVTVPCYT